MSFSFSVSGTPKTCIATVGQQAAVLDQCPNGFADALNDQLGRLPENAVVSGSIYGHTGWPEGQTSGEISLHANLSVSVPQPEA